jgi:hypothetical protein
MIPVLKYVIDQRIMWCTEVDILVKEVATSVKRNYPVRLEAVSNNKDFKKNKFCKRQI